MSNQVRIEMSKRLAVIIRAAQVMQSDIVANNLAYIRKKMQEIEQYSNLVRIDVDYLTIPERRGIDIKACFTHDAGAYGQCQYCQRYSDIQKILSHEIACECGSKTGWSGSFKAPNKNSIWKI